MSSHLWRRPPFVKLVPSFILLGYLTTACKSRATPPVSVNSPSSILCWPIFRATFNTVSLFVQSVVLRLRSSPPAQIAITFNVSFRSCDCVTPMEFGLTSRSIRTVCFNGLKMQMCIPSPAPLLCIKLMRTVILLPTVTHSPHASHHVTFQAIRMARQHFRMMLMLSMNTSPYTLMTRTLQPMLPMSPSPAVLLRTLTIASCILTLTHLTLLLARGQTVSSSTIPLLFRHMVLLT